MTDKAHRFHYYSGSNLTSKKCILMDLLGCRSNKQEHWGISNSLHFEDSRSYFDTADILLGWYRIHKNQHIISGRPRLLKNIQHHTKSMCHC